MSGRGWRNKERYKFEGCVSSNRKVSEVEGIEEHKEVINYDM